MSKKPRQQAIELTSHSDLVEHINGKKKPIPSKYKPDPIQFKTKRQKTYYEALFANQIVVATGPAGTAKTFVAVYAALAMFAAGQIDKIIITKPTVEVGEEMGALPGDVDEKMAPFVRSVLDCFNKIIGEPATNELYYSKHIIEIVPLQHMRGLTFDRAFIIADEMQNARRMQTKMLLTRLSDEAILVINGDMDQTDLPRDSGLPEALEILQELKNDGEAVDTIEFTVDDIVRSGIVKKIIIAYHELDKEKHVTRNNR